MKTYTDAEIAQELRHYNPETNKLGGIAHQLSKQLNRAKIALRYYRTCEVLTTQQQEIAEEALKP